jgi:hypothetical protein
MQSPSASRFELQRRRLIPAVLLLGLAGSACGLRVDASTPEYQQFFTSVVSAAGTTVVGDGSAVHGGIVQPPASAKAPVRPLKPGEVYLGNVPLEVRLPNLKDGISGVTDPQWAALFLPRIGAPVCGNNLVAVVAWQAQEGTRAAWNPLATTQGMSGATQFNGVGVKNYTSLEQGLQATALTLWRGRTSYGYGPVVQGLRACAPPMWTAQAIQASLWCRNCAGGQYLTAIVPAVIADFNRAFLPRQARG